MNEINARVDNRKQIVLDGYADVFSEPDKLELKIESTRDIFTMERRE